MSSIGYATLQVIPSLAGVTGSLQSQLSGPMQSVGSTAGTQFGGGFNRVLSGGLIAAGVVAATGASLIAIGTQFDDAYDTIQTGTGATGDALEGLKDVFRDVVADVPTDFESAADAITLLNQRLEVTGRPLEQLAEQFLNLSNITGDDLNGNIDSVTRAFGDWSVATEDQSDVLDRFFRASQDSGVAVGELAEGVVQFGSPLRQLGFSLDESIALFASFGEAGVNTSTVMSGLRQAVKNFASGFAEAETGMTSFDDVLWQVEHGMFTFSDAVAIFGSRAAPDLFAALQEGRFELEDFLGAMRNTQGGINETAEDTRDFGESFEILKNNVMLLLEGPATSLMDWLSTAAEEMSDFSQLVREEGWGAGFDDLRGKIADATPQMQLLVGAVAALAIAFAAAKVQALLMWVVGLGPIAWTTVAIVALGVALNELANNWDWAGDRAGHVSDVIAEGLGRMPGQTAAAGEAFGSLTGTIQDTDQAASDLDVTGRDLAGTWEFVRGAWSSAWEGITSIVQNGVDNVGNFVGSGMDGVKSLWNSAWSSVKGQVLEAWTGITSTVRNGITNVVSFLQGLPNRATTAISGLVSGLTNKGREAMQGLRNALTTVWGNIRSWLSGLPERAASALADLPGKLYNIGVEAIQGLWNGLKSLAGNILSWVGQLGTSIAGSISGALEVNSPSRVMERIGVYTMEGLELGMRDGWMSIVRWLRTLDPGADIFGDTGGFGGVNVFDIDDAQIASSRILMDIQDAWRAIQHMFTNDMPNGFQAGTQSGNAFMRALQDQAANIRNYVNALTAAGDYDGAAAALDRMITMFRLMAVDAGLSADAIDDLIASLFGTLDLSGLADDVESQVSRIEAATGRALDSATSSRYSGESAQTRIVVDANGVDSALVEWLRRSVRVESGGNVQAYLGA